MFKNRAAQVTFVKTPKEPTVSNTTTGHWHIDFPQISKIMQEQVRTVAVVAVAAAVVLKVTDTACEIAVNYAPKK